MFVESFYWIDLIYIRLSDFFSRQSINKCLSYFFSWRQDFVRYLPRKMWVDWTEEKIECFRFINASVASKEMAYIQMFLNKLFPIQCSVFKFVNL